MRPAAQVATHTARVARTISAQPCPLALRTIPHAACLPRCLFATPRRPPHCRLSAQPAGPSSRRPPPASHHAHLVWQVTQRAAFALTALALAVLSLTVRSLTVLSLAAA